MYNLELRVHSCYHTSLFFSFASEAIPAMLSFFATTSLELNVSGSNPVIFKKIFLVAT